MNTRNRIEQLVKEHNNQAKVARLVGLPRSTLNEYLKGKHPNNNTKIEKLFEAYFDLVPCPVFGDITKEDCYKWYHKPYVATNGFNAKIRQACKNCLYGLCNNRKE